MTKQTRDVLSLTIPTSRTRDAWWTAALHQRNRYERTVRFATIHMERGWFSDARVGSQAPKVFTM